MWSTRWAIELRSVVSRGYANGQHQEGGGRSRIYLLTLSLPLHLPPTLQISFHDTSKMPSRPPILSDPWGLSLGALGMSGALHASSDTLVYR